jgi:hypothetical protein
MPTPDASQFTTLKKYNAIDSRGDNGVKVFTHLYQPVPSVRHPIDFLPSFTNKNATPFCYIPINYPQGNANGKKYELPLPAINNLEIASGGEIGDDTAVLTWYETNVTSRSISFTPTLSAPTVSNFTAGTVTLSRSTTDVTFAVTITVTNARGSVSASINVSVGCFLGFVKVKTLDGPVSVEDIVVGTKILQPTGKYSKVVELKRTTITDRVSDGDGRLYADADEKMVVTYWHKIRFSDETEEVKAGEHPRLHQVFRPTPFDVFHIKLEDPVHDKVLIHDTDITAESFVPVNPL